MKKSQLLKMPILVLLALCLQGCVDPFPFVGNQAGKGDLVVDGFIAAGYAPYVRLSRVAEFVSIVNAGGYAQPESGARVFLVDSDNNEELLIESSYTKGIYFSPNIEFIGETGKTYYLKIITWDDKIYQSEPEKIINDTSLDSAYLRLETFIRFAEGTNNLVETDQLQLYAIFTFPNDSARYLFTWQGTYLVDPPFSDRNCYVYEGPGGLLNLVAGEDYENGAMIEHRIDIIDPWIRFNTRYSLLLVQYSLSEEAYTYYKKIQQQSTSTGGLFDPIPAKIVGNVRNINDPDENVLGYFSARGAKTIRFYTDASRISGLKHLDLRQECVEQNLSWCADCRKIPGATYRRPDFWQD